MTPGLLLMLGVAVVAAWRGAGLLFQVGSDRRAARGARDWPATPGRITRTWVSTEAKRAFAANSDLPSVRYAHTPRLRYEYTVGEHAYHGDRVDYAPPRVFYSNEASDTAEAERYLARYPRGADVAVYYNPDSPREACLSARTESDRGATRMLLGTLVLAFGIGLGVLALAAALG